MAKADSARSVQVSFRIAGELHEKMRRAAEDENRSVSNWLVTVVKRALAERDDTG